jgi:hypothetical protein
MGASKVVGVVHDDTGVKIGSHSPIGAESVQTYRHRGVDGGFLNRGSTSWDCLGQKALALGRVLW